MKNILVVVTLLATLTACSSDTDRVKNGVMGFNKTTTVGQALDNWKSCETPVWKEFKTDSGIRVVEFICSVKVRDWASRIKELMSKDGQTDEKVKATNHLDIVSLTYEFQFTINNDDTFQLNNVQIHNVWADGKSFSDPPRTPLDILKAAYNNELMLDPKMLTELTAPRIDYQYRYIYRLAQ